MNDHNHNLRSRGGNWAFWLIGLGSLAWLLLRSGPNLRRLAYPCQRAALVSSLGFAGYLLSLLGTAQLYHRLKQRVSPIGVIFFTLALLITSGLQSSSVLSTPVRASLTLSTWTSPNAVSDVFVAPNVPTPRCSLDGGTLPETPPCNDPENALPDDGVDALVNLMESKGSYFYQTAAQPEGIVGPNDVVVIKINNQWGHMGYGNGVGRLATNNDVLKGLIWRILQHPHGFSGEVVVAENDQDSGTSWDISPANAEDPNQSFQDVVTAFQSLDYPVSLYNWTSLNYNLMSGGAIGDSGYPTGEYANGDMSDAYILLEDPAATGTNELSYPKFQTANGAYVSMRYGVWDGSSYDSDRLTFINLPVLKQHGMAGATIAWKNLIGFVSTFDEETRYGSWDEMHDFYWGYTEGANRDYGLLGRDIALIRAPDLHVVDAIWVGYEDNYDGDAIRQDALLASIDPFAVDWYASEYLLLPLSGGNQDTSAARAGIFRNATRTNQNVAELVWPGGSGNYPYIDLLDSYDGDAPSDDEKNQINVYSTQAPVIEEPAAEEPEIEEPTAEELEIEEPEIEEPEVEEPEIEEPEAEEPEVEEPETEEPEAEARLPVLPAGAVVDDFEGTYEPDQGWEVWSDDQTGDSLRLTLDDETAHSGNASLRLEFESWADFGRSFDPAQDWSSGAGLSLWLATEGNQELDVTLYAGEVEAPTPFEAWFEISPQSADPSGWILVELPWDHFLKAEWADEGGPSEFDPSRVFGLGLGFAMPDDSQVENTVWVDDIHLLDEAPQPAPVAAEPVAPPAPTAAPMAAAPTSPPAPAAPAEAEEQSSGGCPLSLGLILVGVALAWRSARRQE